MAANACLRLGCKLGTSANRGYVSGMMVSVVSVVLVGTASVERCRRVENLSLGNNSSEDDEEDADTR